MNNVTEIKELRENSSTDIKLQWVCRSSYFKLLRHVSWLKVYDEIVSIIDTYVPVCLLKNQLMKHWKEDGQLYVCSCTGLIRKKWSFSALRNIRWPYINPEVPIINILIVTRFYKGTFMIRTTCMPFLQLFSNKIATWKKRDSRNSLERKKGKSIDFEVSIREDF